MNWFFSVVRIAGASFPLSASAVQLQAEVDSAAIKRSLQDLKDPLSALHPDIRPLSAIIYETLVKGRDSRIELTPDQYEQFARPLALLEGQGQISGSHALTAKFVNGFRVAPTYVAYMSALFGDPSRLDSLVERIDTSPAGTWLDGELLAPQLGVPLPIIQAFFRLYEARGLGLCSKTIGVVKYLCQA